MSKLGWNCSARGIALQHRSSEATGCVRCWLLPLGHWAKVLNFCQTVGVSARKASANTHGKLQRQINALLLTQCATKGFPRPVGKISWQRPTRQCIERWDRHFKLAFDRGTVTDVERWMKNVQRTSCFVPPRVTASLIRLGFHGWPTLHRAVNGRLQGAFPVVVSRTVSAAFPSAQQYGSCSPASERCKASATPPGILHCSERDAGYGY